MSQRSNGGVQPKNGHSVVNNVRKAFMGYNFVKKEVRQRNLMLTMVELQLSRMEEGEDGYDD